MKNLTPKEIFWMIILFGVMTLIAIYGEMPVW